MFVHPDILLTVPLKLVFLVLLVVTLAHQPLLAKDALLLSFFKELFANLSAMMVSPPLDPFVKDAPVDVKDVLKISSATIAKMDSSHTKENATPSALLELLETDQLETGSALLATLPARLASTTPHSVPVASTDKDISRPQLSHNHVF